MGKFKKTCKEMAFMLNRIGELIALLTKIALYVYVGGIMYTLYMDYMILRYAIFPGNYSDLVGTTWSWLTDPNTRMLTIAFSVLPATVLAIAFLLQFAATECEKASQGRQKPLKTAIETDVHGNDLKAVMQSIREEDIEYCAFFTVAGKKMSEWTCYSRTAVRFPGTMHDCNGMFLVHNHPGIEEMAFSSDDLGYMLQYHLRAMIVVTRRYTYIMENMHWREQDSSLRSKEAKAYLEGLIQSSYGFWGELRTKLLASERRHNRNRMLRNVAKKYEMAYTIQKDRSWFFEYSMTINPGSATEPLIESVKRDRED